jgi:AraC family transcriptional regulator
MPTVRVLLDAPGLELGVFRCLPGDPAWRSENCVGEGYHVVIPGPPVLIAQSWTRPVVTNMNHAVFYNSQEVYRRGLLSDRGDHCVFIRADAAVVREVAADVDPGLGGRSEFRFPFVDGPLDAQTHLEHRLLVERLAGGSPDRLFAEEAVLRLLRAAVAQSVGALRAAQGGRGAPRRATEADHRDLVEAANSVLSRRFTEPLALHEIAASVHASPFHLARVFRAHTGSGLHAYRNQLRLRSSLEALADPRREVRGVAMELGFASSSHFIESFRAAFGMSPSTFRRGTPHRREAGAALEN